MNEVTAPDRARAMYDFGPTPIFAARSDPRFSYCLYVPQRLREDPRPPALVVYVHGTGRSFTNYRDAMAGFARWNNCIVLAPLFPVGVLGDGNRDGYKRMVEGDIRYDRLLLSMVDEVAEKYGIDTTRFAMAGFSGGGHFTHRFLLMHPKRLWAASIGAPGSITQIDPDRDWWVGTRDMKAKFGMDVDVAAMREVAVQMVVGAADLETWEITFQEGRKGWMPGANDSGRTRPERLETLRRNFEKHGIAVRFDLVPNVPHDGLKVMDQMTEFFADALAKHRAR